MPVQPTDYRSKTLELAEANGWDVKDMGPSEPHPFRYVISRGKTQLLARFTRANAFALAHFMEGETISRYITLEQILTAPEDSVPVMPKAGELTGSVVRHELVADGEKAYPMDNEEDHPMLVTTANSVVAQRQDPETREWVTRGIAGAYGEGEGRYWIVNSGRLGEIARIGGGPMTNTMTERDMRRAVVAIMREMF